MMTLVFAKNKEKDVSHCSRDVSMFKTLEANISKSR